MALADKRLFLLDMDGTLYLDNRLFDKVPEFLSHVRRIGGRYLFLTNNSSRGVEGYMEKLSRMGIPTAPEDYLTSVDAAIDHIAHHSTGHSDAILTTDDAAAKKFTALVDSAAVYVNASTRFTDGGEFGLGCEMGLSTQKLHARGPMGLEELCTTKYIIHGSGNIR